jgi:hypothetical protein
MPPAALLLENEIMKQIEGRRLAHLGLKSATADLFYDPTQYVNSYFMNEVLQQQFYLQQQQLLQQQAIQSASQPTRPDPSASPQSYLYSMPEQLKRALPSGVSLPGIFLPQDTYDSTKKQVKEYSSPSFNLSSSYLSSSLNVFTRRDEEDAVDFKTGRFDISRENENFLNSYMVKGVMNEFNLDVLMDDGVDGYNGGLAVLGELVDYQKKVNRREREKELEKEIQLKGVGGKEKEENKDKIINVNEIGQFTRFALEYDSSLFTVLGMDDWDMEYSSLLDE